MGRHRRLSLHLCAHAKETLAGSFFSRFRCFAGSSLFKDPLQIELLRELMKLQKDMIIMLLSMLEGNVLNGPSESSSDRFERLFSLSWKANGRHSDRIADERRTTSAILRHLPQDEEHRHVRSVPRVRRQQGRIHLAEGIPSCHGSTEDLQQVTEPFMSTGPRLNLLPSVRTSITF